LSHRDAFTAIADPTRRQILDLLRTQGPLVAGAIASNFRTASRPAISRHLRVLKECGVVTARREGKTQNYALRPEPLNDLHAGWLANFSEGQMNSLKSLRQKVESGRSGA
jgi:DNA-binding transcriptional ArsR family regulator